MVDNFDTAVLGAGVRPSGRSAPVSAEQGGSPPLVKRIAELEDRLEGVEYLLARVLADRADDIAPDAARKVLEERYATTSIQGPADG